MTFCRVIKVSLWNRVLMDKLICDLSNRLAMKHIGVFIDATQYLFSQGSHYCTTRQFLLSADKLNQAARKEKIAIILHP